MSVDSDSKQQNGRPDNFRWICLSVAVVFALAILWQINSLKTNVTRSLDSAKKTVSKANEAVTTINGQLPQIVGEIKKGTETLSGLAEDVELIKSVAGLQSQDSNRGLRDLANYADEIQRVLRDQTEGKNATIMIEEIIGSDLKEVESVDEFLIGLNKEMLTLIMPFAKSKQEVLYRASYSGPPRRKPYFVRIDDNEPVQLDAFIKLHHPASAELPEFKN